MSKAWADGAQTDDRDAGAPGRLPRAEVGRRGEAYPLDRGCRRRYAIDQRYVEGPNMLRTAAISILVLRQGRA